MYLDLRRLNPPSPLLYPNCILLYHNAEGSSFHIVYPNGSITAASSNCAVNNTNSQPRKTFDSIVDDDIQMNMNDSTAILKGTKKCYNGHWQCPIFLRFSPLTLPQNTSKTSRTSTWEQCLSLSMQMDLFFIFLQIFVLFPTTSCSLQAHTNCWGYKHCYLKLQMFSVFFPSLFSFHWQKQAGGGDCWILWW